MTSSAKGNVGLNISILNRAAQSYFYHNLKRFGIGPGQQAYLLSLYPGEIINQEELAARLKVDRANVTRAVKDLEQKGYITRKQSGEDRRVWMVKLSKKGISVRREVEEIAKGWIDKLRSSCDPGEWDLFDQLLGKITSSLEK